MHFLPHISYEKYIYIYIYIRAVFWQVLTVLTLVTIIVTMTIRSFSPHIVNLAARDLEKICGVEKQLETVQKEFEQLQNQLNELFDYFSPKAPPGDHVPLVFGPPLGRIQHRAH